MTGLRPIRAPDTPPDDSAFAFRRACCCSGAHGTPLAGVVCPSARSAAWPSTLRSYSDVDGAGRTGRCWPPTMP